MTEAIQTEAEARPIALFRRPVTPPSSLEEAAGLARITEANLNRSAKTPEGHVKVDPSLVAGIVKGDDGDYIRYKTRNILCRFEKTPFVN